MGLESGDGDFNGFGRGGGGRLQSLAVGSVVGWGGRQLHDPLGMHGLEMGWHGLQGGT